MVTQRRELSICMFSHKIIERSVEGVGGRRLQASELIMTTREFLGISNSMSLPINFSIPQCKTLRSISVYMFIALLTNNTGFGRDSRTVIDRTRHVTSPIWSRIDWLICPKIHIVCLCFAELEMDKTVL